MKRKTDPTTATPQQYLQYLKSIWTTHPYPDALGDAVAIELDKKWPGFLKTLKESPPEASTMRGVINGLLKDLAGPLGERNKAIPIEDVAVGELQTLDANACCVEVPAGGYVILINTGLMILVYKLIKSFASMIQFNRAYGRTSIGFFEGYHTLEEIAEYTHQTIGTYLLYNAPVGRMLPVASLSRDQMDVTAALLHFAELFVLAHEFGHIMEGHLSRAKKLKVMLKKEEISVFRPEWNQEHEADVYGLGLILEKVQNRKNSSLVRASACAGPDLLLTIFDLIEKIGKINPTSHPPANLRRLNLRKFALAEEKGLMLAKAFEKLSDEIWTTILKK